MIDNRQKLDFNRYRSIPIQVRSEEVIERPTNLDREDANLEKGSTAPFLLDHGGSISAVRDAPAAYDTFSDRARAFVQIQNGCDESCTYCVIPKLRGAGHSFEPEQIEAQVKEHLSNGLQEVVLTGINLGAYGRDTVERLSLAALLDRLVSLPGLRRLRLSSIDPMDIDAELLRCFARHTVLADHLHLSIQSGDDMILKRMGRKGCHAEILERIAALRSIRPDMVLGADLIVAFPTEDEAAFQKTVNLVQKGHLTLLHVFRYSSRPGTPAAQIPERFRCEGSEAKRRSNQLQGLGRKKLLQTMQNSVGRQAEVLVEELRDGVAHGKCGRFLSVRFSAGTTVVPRALVPVTVTACREAPQPTLEAVENGSVS